MFKEFFRDPIENYSKMVGMLAQSSQISSTTEWRKEFAGESKNILFAKRGSVRIYLTSARCVGVSTQRLIGLYVNRHLTLTKQPAPKADQAFGVSAGFLRAFRHWAWPRFDAGLVENLVNPRHVFTKKLLS
jgi:hypothetical protein